MKDNIYIHIGPHLGLMVANSTPTFAPNEEEYLRKAPILDWVRGLFQNLDDADRREALRFFPELAELNDERVGRLLYCIVRENTAIKAVLEANGVAVDRALEYLESHKGKNYVHENPMTAKFHKPEDGVKYDMYFEDAQAYIEKRGFSVPWNDGDVFVDKDYLVQTVANIIRWADENRSKWSEEDEAMMKGILDRGCSEIPSREFALTAKQTGWLKELTNRFTPQPRQSWGRDEIEKLNKLYAILPQCVDCKPRILGDKECVELQDFLVKLSELKSH